MLNGIDFRVERGEMVAITGESGSGKSTLLHILGLLDKPDSGCVRFNGELAPTEDKLLSKFRNQNIGFVFQFHYLLEDFNARENVAMPRLIGTGNRSESLRIAQDLLSSLGMQHRLNHYPNQLSGGEQQRVAIARALINKPDIVFADEPTGNLDAKHSNEIISLIEELNRDMKQTFVIITHDKSISSRMQKSYTMQDGALRLG
ncbi:MAG: ABC transporter ATP-binding protein [Candidatus Cloacimonetes bacterium]|nr:ABC transporter ATP-binding protein [Candidatus Cloacimonadota bacterium]